MKFKQYNYFKTAKKTATANNLLVSTRQKNVLIDTSILDDLLLSDVEKNIIIADAIRYTSASNKVLYYGSKIDNFTSIDGIAGFYCHSVYNKDTFKRRYVIMQLCKVKHVKMERTSVYNDYETTTQTIDSGYNQPINDIEL